MRRLPVSAHRVIEAGRIGRTRSFVAALGVAMLLLPMSEALAYFAATGAGTISNVQAGSASSVITIAQNGHSPTLAHRPPT